MSEHQREQPARRKGQLSLEDITDRSGLGFWRTTGLTLAYRMLGSVSEAEDLSVSRQILVVVVVRNTRTSDTVSRSMACQRRYASWTALGLPRHRLRPCMSRLVDAEFAAGRQRQMRQQAPPFILDRPARDVAPLQVGEKTPDVIGH